MGECLVIEIILCLSLHLRSHMAQCKHKDEGLQRRGRSAMGTPWQTYNPQGGTCDELKTLHPCTGTYRAIRQAVANCRMKSPCPTAARSTARRHGHSRLPRGGRFPRQPAALLPSASPVIVISCGNIRYTRSYLLRSELVYLIQCERCIVHRGLGESRDNASGSRLSWRMRRHPVPSARHSSSQTQPRASHPPPPSELGT